MKKKIEINLFDEEMNNKNEAVFSAKESIRNKVYDAIIKKGVIDLYPEGPDKKKAVEDFEKAQKSLICSIGAYDSAVAEYKRYYTNNFEKISKLQLLHPRNRTSVHLFQRQNLYDL